MDLAGLLYVQIQTELTITDANLLMINADEQILNLVTEKIAEFFLLSREKFALSIVNLNLKIF
jgi:hypothetical protein